MKIMSIWAAAVVFAMLVIARVLVAGDGLPENNPEIIFVNGNPGVVLDATSYRRDVEGWTPGMDDLQAAEDAVMTVAVRDDRDPFLFGYRQYAGFVEDGERKIVVHSMCQRLDGWDQKFLLVLDGGPCFWQATYNAETGEVETFYVNGQA